jgi:hypothetical protein
MSWLTFPQVIALALAAGPMPAEAPKPGPIQIVNMENATLTFPNARSVLSFGTVQTPNGPRIRVTMDDVLILEATRLQVRTSDRILTLEVAKGGGVNVTTEAIPGAPAPPKRP